ncbi:hypothetical protein BH23ACT11_BH23ACT11_10660 [soil metagenome]
MRVVERKTEHYDVQEVPYGKVYKWRPEHVLFECDCGETLSRSSGRIECRCGAVYDGFDRERVKPENARGAYHPWLEDYEEWRETKIANGIQREYFEFVGERTGD